MQFILDHDIIVAGTLWLLGIMCALGILVVIF